MKAKAKAKAKEKEKQMEEKTGHIKDKTEDKQDSDSDEDSKSIVGNHVFIKVTYIGKNRKNRMVGKESEAEADVVMMSARAWQAPCAKSCVTAFHMYVCLRVCERV